MEMIYEKYKLVGESSGDKYSFYIILYKSVHVLRSLTL